MVVGLTDGEGISTDTFAVGEPVYLARLNTVKVRPDSEVVQYRPPGQEEWIDIATLGEIRATRGTFRAFVPDKPGTWEVTFKNAGDMQDAEVREGLQANVGNCAVVSDSIQLGEAIQVTSTVENTGLVAADIRVEWLAGPPDAQVRDTETVTVQPGATTDVAGEITVTQASWERMGQPGGITVKSPKIISIEPA